VYRFIVQFDERQLITSIRLIINNSTATIDTSEQELPIDVTTVIEKKTEGPKSHVLVFVVPNSGNFRMLDVAFGNLANNVSSSCFVTHALSSEKQQQFGSTFYILFNENVNYLTLWTHCNVEMLMLEL